MVATGSYQVRSREPGKGATGQYEGIAPLNLWVNPPCQANPILTESQLEGAA